MSFQVYVSNREGKHYYALMEGKKLVEYDVRDKACDKIPGAVINGSVQEVSRGLEAAFVNIGPYKQAFLPLDGQELAAYKTGRELPVQIKKAPVEEKGAQVSDKPELAGHYLVLLGGEKRYGVSSRIDDPEKRNRLRRLVAGLSEGKDHCFLARTESEGVSEAEIREEAERLSAEYRNIVKNSQLLPVGAVLFLPPSPASEWFVRYGADAVIFDNLEDKLAFTAAHPEAESIVRLYTDTAIALEDFYKISSQLTKASAKTLHLEGSGTVVIEETTALCAVDVNSGKEGTAWKEETVLGVNLKAAALVLDQLQLRNIGGVIMIDFINMREEAHRDEIVRFMQQKSREDSAKIRIYGFTKLGLLEMTRERKGLSLRAKLH